MTSQQHDTARREFPFGMPEGTAMDVDDTSSHVDATCFGSRLRARREARGLDIESCARSLKLPARVLRQLESDQRGELDHAIYLSSYTRKYAHFLGLDEATIEAQLQSITDAPTTLVATGGISHSRYLLERYTTAATYVVLTAVIIVPMVWLGVRGTLDRDISRLAPLDARPVAQQDAPAVHVPGAVAATTIAASKPASSTPAAAQDQPLMASMASFPELNTAGPSLAPALDHPTSADAVPSAAAATTAADPVSHTLALNLANPSWVEVLDNKGSRLEYGLLPAGSSKTYHSDRPLTVRIGNADGAQVSIDGAPVALDTYRHANIAHFRVDVRDGKAVPAGM